MSQPQIPILYEDNHLLVVVKPCNIPSQADDSGDLDMLELLKADIKRRFNKPGNVFLGLVHRLDRPVGGVMVFAKTSKCASRLSESIRSRQFHKTYLAVLTKPPKEREARLQHYLLKNTTTNMVHVVSAGTKDAKEASLSYRVLETDRDSGLTLVQIDLHTGRPHQIRVQFATIGCALYGDQKYGANVNEPGRQIALWSSHLEFPHPISKQWDHFKSTPPEQYPWTLFTNSFTDIT